MHYICSLKFIVVKKIPRALPFTRKELSLGALCITLHTNCILCKIHEVTPDNTTISELLVHNINQRVMICQKNSHHLPLLNCQFNKSHYQKNFAFFIQLLEETSKWFIMATPKNKCLFSNKVEHGCSYHN